MGQKLFYRLEHGYLVMLCQLRGVGNGDTISKFLANFGEQGAEQVLPPVASGLLQGCLPSRLQGPCSGNHIIYRALAQIIVSYTGLLLR